MSNLVLVGKVAIVRELLRPEQLHGEDGSPERRFVARWSNRCPHCLSTALAPAPKGALRCAACEAVITAPARQDELPAWETDPRLQDGQGDGWERHSRSGRLVATWGRSTIREDWDPTRSTWDPEGDEPEPMPPRVQAEPILGEADELLNAERDEETERCEGLREALEDLKRLLGALHAADAGEGARRRAKTAARPRSASKPVDERPPPSPVEARILDAIAREHGEHNAGDVVDDQANLFKSATELAAAREAAAARAPAPWVHPAWAGALGAAYRAALRSQLEGLGLLVVNALRRRGIEIAGSTEPIHPRTRRATPFASYAHAIAVAHGVSEPGECSALPRNAIAKHALPRGVVLGQIACKPTRSYSSAAKETAVDEADIWDAIAAARVGARTWYEDGEQRHDAGRPLSEVERELVRLVDAGDVHAHAVVSVRGRRGRLRQQVERYAVEQLHPREALERVRHLEGAPRTEHEVRLMLKGARKAIRLELGRRGLIPGFVVEEPATTSQETAPTSDDRRRGRRKVA